MNNILRFNLLNMKKIIFVMLVAVGIMAVSCSPAVVDREPIVTFYMDNEEITSNSVEVPLNSYREIKIKTEAIGINSNRGVGIYQYVKHGHVLQFDGQQTKGLYALTDSLMQHNLIHQSPAIIRPMERELKAIIQQYMERMTKDDLKYSE